jgi:hypothetical protein
VPWEGKHHHIISLLKITKKATPGSHSSVRRLAPGLAGDGGWRSPAHASTWPPRCGRAGAARLLQRQTILNKKISLFCQQTLKKI